MHWVMLLLLGLILVTDLFYSDVNHTTCRCMCIMHTLNSLNVCCVHSGRGIVMAEVIAAWIQQLLLPEPWTGKSYMKIPAGK